MSTRPMSISIEQRRVEDLVARVKHARFASPNSPSTWEAGVDPSYLAEFATFWGQQFDWRAAETELNHLDHRLANVAGVELHFVSFKPSHPARAASLPVMLAHGWPSSFWRWCHWRSASVTRALSDDQDLRVR